jgi:hypothetical protein
MNIFIFHTQPTGNNACQTGTTGGFAIPEILQNITTLNSITNYLVNKKDTLM